MKFEYLTIKDGNNDKTNISRNTRRIHEMDRHDEILPSSLTYHQVLNWIALMCRTEVWNQWKDFIIVQRLRHILLNVLFRRRKQGYDAAMSFCFGDPGVTEARENVSIPVIGVGEAALHTAMMCGVRVGILSGGRHLSKQASQCNDVCRSQHGGGL